MLAGTAQSVRGVRPRAHPVQIATYDCLGASTAATGRVALRPLLASSSAAPSRPNSLARSIPVRSVPSWSPWATLLATDLVIDEAPSVEITVILSMPLSGALAAL